MFEKLNQNGIVIYVSPLLQRIGVAHAFSTRQRGVSDGPFASLNLGNPTGCESQDSRKNIQANYRRLQTAIGCENRTRCFVHQVHGCEVLEATGDEPFDCSVRADGIVTDDPARVLSIRVADCVPVLLASRDGKLVAAVHAGWRGVVAGIVPAAVRAMIRRRSNLKSQDVFAAIGPCISMDHFEVGPEVLAEFTRVFGPDAPVRRREDGKGHVDLRESIRRQLMSTLIPHENIDISDCCTYRDRDEFFSHRRDNGITGRLAALIAPAA